MAWSRDKQYLVADRPGAAVTFSVDVGEGGTVMADWLRSRSYDLGDVSACACFDCSVWKDGTGSVDMSVPQT